MLAVPKAGQEKRAYPQAKEQNSRNPHRNEGKFKTQYEQQRPKQFSERKSKGPPHLLRANSVG